jgi:hypothetical protein
MTIATQLASQIALLPLNKYMALKKTGNSTQQINTKTPRTNLDSMVSEKLATTSTSPNKAMRSRSDHPSKT